MSILAILISYLKKRNSIEKNLLGQIRGKGLHLYLTLKIPPYWSHARRGCPASTTIRHGTRMW